MRRHVGSTTGKITHDTHKASAIVSCFPSCPQRTHSLFHFFYSCFSKLCLSFTFSMLSPVPDRRSRLPPWASRWLGYHVSPPTPLPRYLTYFWSFIAAFAGLSVLQAIFNYSHYFTARHVPGIIASYVRKVSKEIFYHYINKFHIFQGASAVLVYGVPQAPLAQPRALIGGHFLSALVGICITKLFSLMPSESKFDSLRWIAASLSSAIAIVVMQATETTHPPAGATALLPAVDEAVWELSWYFLPVVLLSSTMLLLVGLLLNNIQRVYPVFWYAPASPTRTKQQQVEPSKGDVAPSGGQPLSSCLALISLRMCRNCSIR